MMVRQPLCAPVGLIHAARVMPVERFSQLDELTCTMSETPLKLSPPPYFPAVQTAPVIVPVLLWPETSSATPPVPASKVQPATRPGGRVSTAVVTVETLE